MATPDLVDPGSFTASAVKRLPVQLDAGCWIWHGEITNSGYGRICVGRGRGNRDLVHRWAYKQMVGPIANGMELDHLCRRKRCINPAHLEQVSTAENQRRGKATKLDWDAVRFIRANCIPRHPEFSMRALGHRFDVTHECIRKIVNHTSWVAEPMTS